MASGTGDRAALISIHPRFAEALMCGDKQVEFRKVGIADGIEHVIVYATAPIQRVLGVLEVERVDRDSPRRLWRRHGRVGGISRHEFDEYYHQRTLGSAIVVSKAHRLPEPRPLCEIGPSRPPQSFQYVASSVADDLVRACG